MTLREWLNERMASAPEVLRSRVGAALQQYLDADASETADRCLSVAETLLGEFIGRQGIGRDAALDLLAIDALASYAFEAASEVPDGLGPLADGAMTRFSRIVAELERSSLHRSEAPYLVAPPAPLA